MDLSIQKVEHTLIEAIALVFLVILIFLQNWRAPLLPIIAVPIVLLGYSINTLTMFAMVLAIGLLVDDAIVVVENVERVMAEDGTTPVEATEKSMRQITGALIGIALVLSAVFLPMAFSSGSTGVIYRQFSVTVISAMLLSAAVAPILTPAMCATMLKQHGPTNRSIIGAPGWAFNCGFTVATNGYAAVLQQALKWPFAMLMVLVGLGAWQIYGRINSSFLPTEDQGVLMTRISLTEGSTTAATLDVVEQVETYLKTEEKDAVECSFTAMGFGFAGSGQNQAMLFVKLKDFDQRSDPKLSATATAIAARANARFGKLRAGSVRVSQPPAIQGLGNQAGFLMYLIDQTNLGTEALFAASTDLIRTAEADGRVAGLRSGATEDQAALKLVIDQEKAAALGVSIG